MSVRAPADPGLQPERTVLSWGRTAFALLATALVFVRWYPQEGVWAFAPAAVCLVASAVLVLGQRRRYRRRSRGLSAGRIRPPVRSVIALTVLVVALAAMGGAVVLLLP